MQQDYTFMNRVITQFKQVLGVAPTGKYGNAATVDFNFAAAASSTTTYNLGTNGLIAYLYYNAYDVIIPNIFGVIPDPTTVIEKAQIYSVYDAIGIPRPAL